MRVPSRAGTAALALLALIGGPGGAGAADAFPDPASATSAREGAAYLATTQGQDGSVAEGWRVDQVAEAIVALMAGGAQDASVERALDFISANAAAFLDPAHGDANGPRVGRVVAGLVAARMDPRNFDGTDWVARLEQYYVPASGSYGGDNFYADLLAMLGILAAGEDLPLGAVERIRVNQCDGADPHVDGGWTWRASCVSTPDTDTTSMALSVLAAALGPDAPEVREARDWLLRTQDDAGCWGLEPGEFENANSCGLAVSAVVALGENPRSGPWAEGSDDPATRLRGLQLPSGGFRYRMASNAPNDYSTVQAVPALAGWSYPVAAPEQPEPGQGEAGSGNTTSSTSTSPPRSSRSSTGGHEPTISPDERAGTLAESPTTPDRATGSSLPTKTHPLDAAPAMAGSPGADPRAGRGRERGPATDNARRGPVTVRETDSGQRGMGVPLGIAVAALALTGAGTGWAWCRRRAPFRLETVRVG